MKKITALLMLALISMSFRFFDTAYFALTVNFSQDWTNTALINVTNDWSSVPSIEGYQGQNITTSTGVDPQTLLTTSALGGDLNVFENQTNPNTFTSGGVAEFQIANPTIALQGSGTADAPYVIMYLNTTGATNIKVQYNLRDIDGSADNATQPVALQYRVGTTGNFTNIPAAFVADATTGPSLATLITPVSVILPAACNNQAQVQVRIITANAGGNDEWVGIDDILVTPNAPVNNISISGGGNVPEAGPAGTFTLSFNPVTTVSTDIDYSLAAGTATLTTDYSIALSGGTPANISAATGTISVPSGTSSITLTVTPVNDAIQETNETASITISNPTQSYSLGTTNAVVTFIDDDIDPVNYTGVPYSQDFNTLVAAGASSVTPIGWLFAESGVSANTSYSAGTGSGNTGDTYSFGTDQDRAFGGLRSGNLVPTVGAKIQNNSGATISSMNIAYRGEQWRLGSTGRSDRLDFQYSINATSLTTGTWIDADGLDFIGPISSGATGALDGNNAANRRDLNFTLNGLSISAGAIFYIRWVDQDAAGADDGLAIDNVVLSPGCTPPTNQPTSLNLTQALTSVSGSYTAATAGTNPADAYLVLISTSPTLTDQPINGTAYALDDVIGNATVVAINGTTSFTASGLAPATTYYFFIYSTASATQCYTIGSPLTGSIATLSPPVCTPPTIQASGLTASNTTGTSLDLNYIRGNGDNIIILARSGSPVTGTPINGVTYTAGIQIGAGNFVIYNGNAATFSYTSLTQNTTYHFALFEYSNATPCYTTPPLTGNFTTSCVTPVNVTGFSPSSANGAVSLSWTNPTVSCFDEILVIASNAPITNAGNTFIGTGNPVYAGPGQIVFRGTGTGVTVTGLTNGINYFFKIFTRNNGTYSSGVQTSAVPFDPASGYLYLYGNLHAHSSYSDGNKDNTAKIPADDYAFARDAECMDFLGISEHNHATAGLNINNYPLGFAQANAINGVPSPLGNSIVTLWGMEWGTISGGGHMLVYGFDDQVIGWEPGNYNIFCEKGDYTSLLGIINNQPNSFASLAHPNSADYNNIAGTAYSASKDDAIVSSAIESGPAFSTSTTYNDFPSSLGYLSYYKTMLAKGYRIGATMDQDNHNMTFGTANRNRLVILSPAKTRTEIVNAMRNMRFYASQDCNVQVDYKINSSVIGSSVVNSGVPTVTLSTIDLDGENAATIELWGGAVGGSVPGSALKTYSAVNSVTFNSGDVQNTQPNNTTYYYYFIITQDDGNKIVTSPIWYSRSDIVLPVTWVSVDAKYNSVNKTTLITWSTAQEIDSKSFNVERSTDGGTSWSVVGSVNAAGNSTNLRNYSFVDSAPQEGTNLYRIKQIDLNAQFSYSKVVAINIRTVTGNYFTVYPNPASGSTAIYSNTTIQKVRIQLLDINGKISKDFSGNLTANAATPIDLRGLSAGIYLIKIGYQDKVIVEKIIVR